MNSTSRKYSQQPSQAGTAPAGGSSPGASGPTIDLGMGRRRVTGNDLNVFQAIVSGNDQTIKDLTAMKGNPNAAFVAREVKERPAFVTEGWLDRFNACFCAWLTGAGTGLKKLVVRKPTDTHSADGHSNRPRRAA